MGLGYQALSLGVSRVLDWQTTRPRVGMCSSQASVGLPSEGTGDPEGGQCGRVVACEPGSLGG